MCILYIIVYNFTRFSCTENHTPQDHFRCVMVCYRTRTPQKTRPATMNIDSSDYLCALNETKQKKQNKLQKSYMDETHLMVWQL